ncbi:recombinase family protein [Wenjunlia tyrosinilytica]|uniref:recombinase family protein n=1 Tax=Wenjunlia tyrosinilytica TaxID=1544741 RepID=UPI001664F45B|nr:recombinase family protein [Wenjunlia tyrosinilytica]
MGRGRATCQGGGVADARVSALVRRHHHQPPSVLDGQPFAVPLEDIQPPTAQPPTAPLRDTAPLPDALMPLAPARASGLRGRPPYGCRVATVSVDGTQRQALVPDERTAHIVVRIFDEYLADNGLQGIAEGLTADGIPSPGAVGRDPERRTVAWSKSAVRAILVNSRYAGRTSSGEPGGTALVSPPIVAPEVFDRVQLMFDRRRTRPAAGEAPAGRPYILRGLVRCARCNRLMQGTWNNGEPYYRCRFPAEYASANRIDHPRNVYLREQAVLGPLTSWLRTSCSPRRLMQLVTAARTGAYHEATVAATARHLRVLREAEGQAQASAFQALGLRLTYSDSNRMLRVKAVLGPAELVIRGVLAL